MSSQILLITRGVNKVDSYEGRVKLMSIFRAFFFQNVVEDNASLTPPFTNLLNKNQELSHACT